MQTKPFAAVFLTCLMITAVSQAESGPDRTEGVIFAHPEQAGAGQPFLVRLTSARAFDGISIHWMGKVVIPSVSRWNGHHVALAMLGTDILTIEPGLKKLAARIRTGGKETVCQRSVTIVAQSFPRQELTLAAKMVTPPKTALERIKSERVRTTKAKNTRSASRLWRLPFHRPVKGKITSAYGLRRVLNGIPKDPHRGLDFRAPKGTAVEAVADGRVILAESHYYAGNSMYIDHGNGVVSLYFHLDTFEASQGDRVKRGQTIGHAGSTGRATGPHLHLSVAVQGFLVNPSLLFEKTIDPLLR